MNAKRHTLFSRKNLGVIALLSATALGAAACSSGGGDSGAAPGAGPSVTSVESVQAGSADAVAPVEVSNCQPADGPSGRIGEEQTEAGPSDRDIAVAPEVGSGYRSGMQAVTTQNFAVSTANPVATAAACDVLLSGGNAADALVTAQFMLGLVEPQSSGLGGGGYILYFDKESGETIAVDGREVAPLAADENYLTQVSAEDDSEVKPDARASGRSIGVPGIVAALDVVHERFGHNEWKDVVQPAADTAREGFEVSPRLATSIASEEDSLAASPNAARYFLDADGKAWPAGHTLVNEDYAEVVERIGAEGPDAFYTGDIAAAIVEEANRENDNLTPSRLTTADLAGYTPEVREVLCAPYRELEVCGAPPSSSGGVAVLEALKILDGHDLAGLGPQDAGPDGALPSAEAIHLISEAQRLAYADRDAYVADPAFADVPGGVEALLADGFIAQRSELIDGAQSMGQAQPGDLGEPVSAGPQLEENGTTHISIIDGEGNAVSATTSVEAAFGSFHFAKGMVLNNQLTDFSAEPTNEEGTPVANRVEPAKRPRSSMSPLLVFDGAGGDSDGERGPLRMVLGSPGGSLIIQYVIKTLVQMTDWGMNPQQAISAPNFGALNKPETSIGGEHPDVAGGGAGEAIAGLEERGHTVATEEMSSGLSALVVTDDGIVGGADPRREGIVLGN
ncbi:gamma-glutamyltransferase [Corynebacterium camporealensis]|uniref:gamma-glutamyltransferase n=1 Tax=Corynebacterium camporealensis TaxID=161896 RepID=UPI00389AB703